MALRPSSPRSKSKRHKRGQLRDPITRSFAHLQRQRMASLRLAGAPKAEDWAA